MTCLDDGADEPRDTNAVGPHLDSDRLAVGVCYDGAHGLGVLGAEIEDMPDLDAASDALSRGLHLGIKSRSIMLLVRRGIVARPGLDQRCQIGPIVDIFGQNVALKQRSVAEHLTLASMGEHDELVAQVAADRPGRGAHGDRLQTHARECAQIGDEHAVIGAPRAVHVEIEGIVVLHQELAPAHHAEAWPHLIAKLPLNLI